MRETTYYQRKRELISNRAKYHYESNKELLRERIIGLNTLELSEEEKI